MLPLKDFKALHRMVDQVFAEASGLDLSDAELADKAGVGAMTVWRLRTFQTAFPRLQTVYLLGRAVGLTLKLESRVARRGVA